jgi:cell division protein FtsN
MTEHHRPREIQLTSKQLVFVFMSTVFVAVVIFLLGVWVGRGIGLESVTASYAVTEGDGPKPPTAPSPDTLPAAPPEQKPLTYPGQLQGSGASAPPSPSEPPPATITPAPPTTSERPKEPEQEKEKERDKAEPQPDGKSWFIQVGSFSAKAGADKTAAEFRGKGLPVVVTPGPKFRVWIGPYPQEAAMNPVVARLKKEGTPLSVIKPR